MNKVLVILGPTATGKTDLALSLARKFNGELISCDSRQVYKGLDIGTGKIPTSSVILSGAKNLIKKGKGYWEINGIKIWMLDVVNPKKRYTVFDYENDVKNVLENLNKRQKLPIIIGGSGLYLKALIKGFDSLAIPLDNSLRKRLEEFSVKQLQDELKGLSVEKFNNLNNSDSQNPRRLIRAIEIITIPTKNKRPIGPILKGFEILKIGLTTRREIIFKRIRDRILTRLDSGMIEEVKRLYKNGLSIKRMKELGLEYSVIADYITGVIKTKEDLIKHLRLKIGQYAKRQTTWFKKEKDVNWFDITEKGMNQKVEKKVSDWYNS